MFRKSFGVCTGGLEERRLHDGEKILMSSERYEKSQELRALQVYTT